MSKSAASSHAANFGPDYETHSDRISTANINWTDRASGALTCLAEASLAMVQMGLSVVGWVANFVMFGIVVLKLILGRGRKS